MYIFDLGISMSRTQCLGLIGIAKTSVGGRAEAQSDAYLYVDADNMIRKCPP